MSHKERCGHYCLKNLIGEINPKHKMILSGFKDIDFYCYNGYLFASNTACM